MTHVYKIINKRPIKSQTGFLRLSAHVNVLNSLHLTKNKRNKTLLDCCYWKVTYHSVFDYFNCMSCNVLFLAQYHMHHLMHVLYQDKIKNLIGIRVFLTTVSEIYANKQFLSTKRTVSGRHCSFFFLQQNDGPHLYQCIVYSAFVTQLECDSCWLILNLAQLKNTLFI